MIATMQQQQAGSLLCEHEFLLLVAGVRRAEAMPRVSEWVPEIVSYIEVIVGKGFAYAAAGSVFFDTCAFE